MDFIKLSPGNNQEIYIDPDILYIKSEWIDKENMRIVMPKLLSGIDNIVYDTYRNLFEYLYNNGYKVITDSSSASDECFFFTPCLDKHINISKDDYVFKKYSKIDLSLSNVKIERPFTVPFPIDSFPILLPALPFVLKNEENEGGKEKFLIETEQQLNILKKFYEESTSYVKKRTIESVKKSWSYDGDLEFDDYGHSNRGISISFIDYKKLFHNNMVLQEYINTPTKYNTSLRVLTSSSGDILCSSLKYSEVCIEKERQYHGYFDRYLSSVDSPYYIGAKSIVSNTVAGGDSILFGKGSYTQTEKDILLEHAIDLDNLMLPEDVKNVCIDIAVSCRREIGAICGLDFIYDARQEKWKYLEEHEYPMLYSYAEKYDLPYDVSAEDFYKTDQLLDLRVRIHALELYMQKKYQYTKQ